MWTCSLKKSLYSKKGLLSFVLCRLTQFSLAWRNIGGALKKQQLNISVLICNPFQFGENWKELESFLKERL